MDIEGFLADLRAQLEAIQHDGLLLADAQSAMTSAYLSTVQGRRLFVRGVLPPRPVPGRLLREICDDDGLSLVTPDSPLQFSGWSCLIRCERLNGWVVRQLPHRGFRLMPKHYPQHHGVHAAPYKIAGVYELGVARNGFNRVVTFYVGSCRDLFQRLYNEYALNGQTQHHYINAAIAQGFNIVYRWVTVSGGQHKKVEEKLAKKYDYAFNKRMTGRCGQVGKQDARPLYVAALGG